MGSGGGDPGSQLGSQVGAAVVHVAGDALAVDDAQVDDVLGPDLDVGRGVHAPAQLGVLGLVVGRANGVVADTAQDARQLHMAPVALVAVLASQVGQALVALDIGASSGETVRILPGSMSLPGFSTAIENWLAPDAKV